MSPRPFGQGEIRSLTGLRGCAATLVMLYHFSLSIPANTLPLQAFLRDGYLCVDLFFVLSGFVMAYSQAGLFSGGYRLRSHAAYLLARIARIYPLYALITIESACLLAWRTPHLDVAAFARTLFLNLALVQAWGLAPSLEGAAWSISTEWGAYLMFPLLLVAAVSSPRRVAGATAVLAMVAVVWVATAPGQLTLPGQSRMGPLDVYSSATVLPLVRCIAEFSLGLVAFRIARDIAGRAQTWAGPLALATGTLIAAGLSRWGSDLWVVALFGILLVSLAPQTGIAARLLGAAVPYRLGQWSYSIYLIHDKFSHPAGALRGWLAERVPMASEIAIVLMSSLVVVCGAITFFVVELPLRKLLLRGVRRLPLVVAKQTAPEASEGGAKALG